MKSIEELLAVADARQKRGRNVNDEFTRLLDLFNRRFPNKNQCYAEIVDLFPTYQVIRIRINRTHEHLRFALDDRREECGVKVYDWRNAYTFADRDGRYHRTTHGRDLQEFLEVNDTALWKHITTTLDSIEEAFRTFILTEWKDSETCKSMMA